LIDFGYNPLKSGIVAFIVIIWGIFFFDWQNINSLILPTKEINGLNDSSLISTIKPEYPTFDPFLYSIDSFIPVINLHQVEYFLPSSSKQRKIFPENFFKIEEFHSEYPLFDGYILILKFMQYNLPPLLSFFVVKYYFSIHNLLGWLFTLIWIAGFSGLVRRLN